MHNVGPCGTMMLDEPLGYYLRNNICCSSSVVLDQPPKISRRIVQSSLSISLCFPLCLPLSVLFLSSLRGVYM